MLQHQLIPITNLERHSDKVVDKEGYQKLDIFGSHSTTYTISVVSQVMHNPKEIHQQDKLDSSHLKANPRK